MVPYGPVREGHRTRRVLVEKGGKVLGVIRVQTILGRMKEYLDSVSAQIARAQMPLF